MHNQRLHYLYHQYIKADATEAELQELMTMADNPIHEEEFHSLMEDSWTELEQIEAHLAEAGKAKVVPLHRRTWFRTASAAVVVLAIALAWYFVSNNGADNVNPSQQTASVQHDVAPGKNGAILRLADGTEIVLDSIKDGNLTRQGFMKVVKKGDQVRYEFEPLASTLEVVYNEMRTPNGRQFQLLLADGTRVWLNAASSIRFPSAFSNETRTVEITGEAYFEVAKDANRPFHVLTKDQDVEVLGTHFNINSYENENAIKTTLLEGSVRVTVADKRSIVLKPGEQSIRTNEKLETRNGVDVDAVLAWKNGLFNFNDADITEIMKQAARWYDVEVKYQGTTSTDKFKGKISRNTNLSQLLKILEINGVKWKVEGKVVTITN